MYNLVFAISAFATTYHEQNPNLIKTFFTFNYSPANTYLCLQEHFGDSIKQINFCLNYQ